MSESSPGEEPTPRTPSQDAGQETLEPREVLLQTSIPAAEALVVRLLESGIDAEIIDRPTSLSVMLAFGTYRVRIGVPTEQRGPAQALLDAWEPDVRANVSQLAATVYRQFGLALVAGAIAFAIHVGIVGEIRLVTLVSPLLVSFAAFLGLACRERLRGKR